MKQWTVRAPLVTSTHSPWRGDFSRFALAQSWAGAVKQAMSMAAKKKIFDFIEITASPESRKNQPQKGVVYQFEFSSFLFANLISSFRVGRPFQTFRINID